METWLSVKQANALTDGQIVLTHVFSYLLAICKLFYCSSIHFKPDQFVI